MNEKFYTDDYPTYKQRQYTKQIINDPMYYPCSNFSTNSSPPANFMDACSISSQNFSFQQSSRNSVSVQQETDLLIWEGRIISDAEKTIKLPDKIETIEISNKDLSPANYCSNIDLIISDSYKQCTSKDIHNLNKIENEWYYSQNSCNQKNTDFTSCAQEKLNKHCNFQKSQDNDFTNKNCNYSDILYENIPCITNNKILTNETAHDYVYNYYENKFMENQSFVHNSHYFRLNTKHSLAPVISPIDQQTECSNEESDIVVEESDEEITDYNDDHEKLLHTTNKCLICNATSKPLGIQFYFLTEKSPLTMTTQEPVIQKLVNIIGNISTARNYLCSECLGLINNIDHLQLKLEQFKSDLVSNFKRSCQENKIRYEKRLSTRKISYVNKLPRYKCKICKKILCLKKYYLYHLKRHRNQVYLCDTCGKMYSSKKKFLMHSAQHKRKLCRMIEGFKCSNCNKIFRTKSNRKEHENYCRNTLPFKCKQQNCDKKFPSATKLKNHVKLKHDKKFIVICSICNIGFTKVSDYKSHMVSHSADKKFSCPKCHKNYKTLSNLNFHMKIHSDKLPFICHTCKKGFMRKEYLEAHVNKHKGIKNFSCTNCEKKFVSQKNLDAHMKYHEGTVKKNTCNICGKSITTGFEEHLRIHNNLREFECEHCDMKFNTKGTLSKHVKKKHLNFCSNILK